MDYWATGGGPPFFPPPDDPPAWEPIRNAAAATAPPISPDRQKESLRPWTEAIASRGIVTLSPFQSWSSPD